MVIPGAGHCFSSKKHCNTPAVTTSTKFCTFAHIIDQTYFGKMNLDPNYKMTITEPIPESTNFAMSL